MEHFINSRMNQSLTIDGLDSTKTIHLGINNLTNFLNNSFNKNISSSCKENIEISFVNIFYASFMVILLVSSLLGNSLVIFAICFSKKLKRRVTNYFILSLGTIYTYIYIYIFN